MTHEQVKASLALITRSSYGTSALLEHSANRSIFVFLEVPTNVHGALIYIKPNLLQDE